MNKDLNSEKVFFFSKLLQFTETEEFLMGHKPLYILFIFLLFKTQYQLKLQNKAFLEVNIFSTSYFIYYLYNIISLINCNCIRIILL